MSQLTNQLMKQWKFACAASNTFNQTNPMKASAQVRVLHILQLEDGIVQSYLAEILDLRPSSMAELLKKLENSGDILRIEDKADKRIKRIFLTEQGREKISNIQKTKDIGEQFFAGLNEEEQQQLSVYLAKIADGWSDDIKNKADSFIEPMDRFAAMQELRAKFIERYGEDFHSLSNQEKREFKKEMRKEMWKMHFMGHRRNPFFNRNKEEE